MIHDTILPLDSPPPPAGLLLHSRSTVVREPGGLGAPHSTATGRGVCRGWTSGRRYSSEASVCPSALLCSSCRWADGIRGRGGGDAAAAAVSGSGAPPHGAPSDCVLCCLPAQTSRSGDLACTFISTVVVIKKTTPQRPDLWLSLFYLFIVLQFESDYVWILGQVTPKSRSRAQLPIGRLIKLIRRLQGKTKTASTFSFSK